LPSRIRIRIPNTDPYEPNPDLIRIRIQSESGSETLDKAREELRQLDQKHAALTAKLKAEADAHR
jgi:hypothetical protein